MQASAFVIPFFEGGLPEWQDAVPIGDLIWPGVQLMAVINLGLEGLLGLVLHVASISSAMSPFLLFAFSSSSSLSSFSFFSGVEASLYFYNSAHLIAWNYVWHNIVTLFLLLEARKQPLLFQVEACRHLKRYSDALWVK